MTQDSKAPDRIWAAPDEVDGWRWPVASKLPHLDRRAYTQQQYILATPSRENAEAVAEAAEKMAEALREIERLAVKGRGVDCIPIRDAARQTLAAYEQMKERPDE